MLAPNTLRHGPRQLSRTAARAAARSAAVSVRLTVASPVERRALVDTDRAVDYQPQVTPLGRRLAVRNGVVGSDEGAFEGEVVRGRAGPDAKYGCALVGRLVAVEPVPGREQDPLHSCSCAICRAPTGHPMLLSRACVAPQNCCGCATTTVVHGVGNEAAMVDDGRRRVDDAGPRQGRGEGGGKGKRDGGQTWGAQTARRGTTQGGRCHRKLLMQSGGPRVGEGLGKGRGRAAAVGRQGRRRPFEGAGSGWRSGLQEVVALDRAARVVSTKREPRF